jgi:hypothetical protein
MLRVLPIFWTRPFPVTSGLFAVFLGVSWDFPVFRGEHEKMLGNIGATSLWWYTLKHHLSGQEDCFVFTVLFPTHFDLHLAFIRENFNLHYWKWLCICIIKVTAFPLQAWRGLEGSRRLRLPDVKTIGTWKWEGCQPYAPAASPPPPAPPERILVLLVEAYSTPGP